MPRKFGALFRIVFCFGELGNFDRLPSQKAGILCGGLEATSVVNGYATGTLTAGDGCSEIGAIAGGVSDSEEITNCRSENVWITVGERAAFVGGMAGRIENRQNGTENALVTAVSRCSVESAEICAGEDSDAPGGMVGGSSASADGGAFVLTDCALSGVTANGEKSGMVGADGRAVPGTETGTRPDSRRTV